MNNMVSATDYTEGMIPGNTLAPVEIAKVGNRSTANPIHTEIHDMFVNDEASTNECNSSSTNNISSTDVCTRNELESSNKGYDENTINQLVSQLDDNDVNAAIAAIAARMDDNTSVHSTVSSIRTYHENDMNTDTSITRRRSTSTTGRAGTSSYLNIDKYSNVIMYVWYDIKYK